MKFFGRARNGKAAKKISTPSLGGISVLFPGPEGWELWSGLPSQPVCAGPAETPQKLRPNPGCVVSLPSRSFFSVPLWVPVVEDSPAREQTQMKLEMKGMLGGSPESAVWNFESIRREQMPGESDGEVIHRQLESTAGGCQQARRHCRWKRLAHATTSELPDSNASSNWLDARSRT